MNTTEATVSTTSTYLGQAAQVVEVDGVCVATVIAGWTGFVVNVLNADGSWGSVCEVRCERTYASFRDGSAALQAALSAVGATSVGVI